MKYWPWVAGLTFFPMTAILHHAAFVRPTCILNNFGNDYTVEVVMRWLGNDPSPYLGALLAVAVFFAGKRWTNLQRWVVAGLIAFIPLTLWIWDIPFTERIICYTFHDGRAMIHSRHLYFFGAAMIFPVHWLLHRYSTK